MIRNVDNIRMVSISEPIFQNEEKVIDLDITYVDNTSLKLYKEGYPDFDRDGSPNIYAYHIKFMTKISETPSSRRKKLIEYQISIHQDPLKWLCEVEDLLTQNYYQFDEKPNFQEAYEDFLEIIADKIQELENPVYQESKAQIKISFEEYNNYLLLFEYNYLKHPSIVFYYSNLHQGLEKCKQELLNNMLLLTNEEKKAYFEKTKFEIRRIHETLTKDFSIDIEKLIKQYNVKEFNIVLAMLGGNQLYEHLMGFQTVNDIDHPTPEEAAYLTSRFTFFNYYYQYFSGEFLSFIDEQERIYFPNQNIQSLNSEIIWKKYDTDLLELITALMESGSINNKTMNLTRKDAIKIFESFFNISIKDAESKLSRATARKKDPSPFLNTLIKAFREYTEKKLE